VGSPGEPAAGLVYHAVDDPSPRRSTVGVVHALTTSNRSSPIVPCALVAACAVASIVALQAWGGRGGLIAVALVPAAVAASADARTGRLPDPLVLGSLAPAIALVAIAFGAGDGGDALVAAGGGAAVAAAPVLVLHLGNPAAMGFGDVKLVASLGATLGLLGIRWPLVALLVASAVTVLVAALRRRSSVPFGPGLVLGAAVALVVAGTLGEAPAWW
jgi:leader peptidase (prepilin peptidase)/N-methyltransferase